MLGSPTLALQDSEWNEQARNETEMQRLDRNWAEFAAGAAGAADRSAAAHRIPGLTVLATAIIGVVLLIFGVVAGRTVGLAAATAIAMCLLLLWIVVPAYIRSWHDDPPTPYNGTDAVGTVAAPSTSVRMDS
jgi:hypothetical protein